MRTNTRNTILTASAYLAIVIGGAGALAQVSGDASSSSRTGVDNNSGSLPLGGQNRSPAIPENMDSTQFNSYVANSWDMNRDGIIDNSEWDSATPSWYGNKNSTLAPFNNWDKDEDGMLNDNETSDMLINSRLYGIYDTNDDNFIDSDEAQRIPAR